jgi:hypothetical protein
LAGSEQLAPSPTIIRQAHSFQQVKSDFRRSFDEKCCPSDTLNQDVSACTGWLKSTNTGGEICFLCAVILF